MKEDINIYWLYSSVEKLKDIGASDIHKLDGRMDDKSFLQAEMTDFQAKSLIPKGYYCYTRTKNGSEACPFWETIEKFPEQSNGYCHYMETGDFMRDGTFLLWDQCKECGVNCGN